MDEKNLKIVFMGTPDFADLILTTLIDRGYNIVGVLTQADKKSGRRQELQKSPAKMTAEKNDILVITPEKLDAETAEKIKSLNPDLIVVAAYGKIIPKSILEISRFNALNVHPSLLPKFRGASPIQNALLTGEKETGTTIMLMDEGVDTGDILSQQKIEVADTENLIGLSKKLAELSAELLLKTIPRWINAEIIPQKQNPAEATYCKILTRKDGKIDWNNSALDIYNKFRAFSPWPGIFSFWERNGSPHRIKLNKINIKNELPDQNQSAGKVMEIAGEVAIQTGSGAIVIEEIQLEGKKTTSIKDFLKGYPDFIGSILK